MRVPNIVSAETLKLYVSCSWLLIVMVVVKSQTNFASNEIIDLIKKGNW